MATDIYIYTSYVYIIHNYYIHIKIYVYIYISADFLVLLLIVLCLNSIQYPQKKSNHHPLWPLPGSLDPSKTVLPPGRECNPAHSVVPGPVRDPGLALGISKGFHHEVQGHPQWTSKGMLLNLQWQTNGQQLAIHRIIESSYHYHRIL